MGIFSKQTDDQSVVLVFERSSRNIVLVEDEALSNIQLVRPDIVDVSTEDGITAWIKSLSKTLQKKLLTIFHRAVRADVVKEIVDQRRKYLPWRAIVIGTMDKETLLRTVEANAKSAENGDEKSFGISFLAKAALLSPSFEATMISKHVNLLVVSSADLGLGDRSTVADLIEAFEPKYLAAWSVENLYNRHLSLCPIELGLILRIRYPKQPKGESLLVASRPIILENGDATMFMVEHGHNESPSLQAAKLRPERSLPRELKIVFWVKKNGPARKKIVNLLETGKSYGT